MEHYMRDAQIGVKAQKRNKRYTREFNYETQWLLYTCSLVAIDLFAVAASLLLAFKLRITSGIISYEAPYQTSTYDLLTVLSAVLWVSLFATFGLYQRDNLLGGNLEYQQVVKACTAGIVVLIIVSFLFREMVLVSRVWILLSWGISILSVFMLRFVARRIAYMLRQYGWFTARVLIVGANDQGIAMAEQWQNSNTSGMSVIGFVDDFKPTGTVVHGDLKVIGRPTALEDLVRSTRANEVVVVPHAVAWETFEEIVENNKHKHYLLRLSPGFYGLSTTSVAVTNKTFVPLFTINEARIIGVDAILKSILDYGLSAFLLITTLPIQILIAILFKLERWNDPVIAHYQVVGNGDETFSMSKFNAQIGKARDNEPGSLLWFHHLIYSMGFDKLPQLFSVLAGHMSLVGPRPAVACGDERDRTVAPNLRSVKPGVLGPWLVHEFWSSNESKDELYYVRNWTIWLDIQILVQTALSWLRIRRAPSTSAQKVTATAKSLPTSSLRHSTVQVRSNDAFLYSSRDVIDATHTGDTNGNTSRHSSH